MFRKVLSYFPDSRGMIKILTGLMVWNAVLPLIKLDKYLYFPVTSFKSLFKIGS